MEVETCDLDFCPEASLHGERILKTMQIGEFWLSGLFWLISATYGNL